MDRRVLVTGGSGFVGTNLIEYFSQQECEILNIDIASPRNPEQRCYWNKVDILDRQRLIDATRKFQPSVFLHFAARTDLNEKVNLAGYAANIEGVSNVMDAIRATSSIQRVIVASSQLVCELGYAPKDEYDYRPSTLYGQSKVLTEKIVRAAKDINACWTLLRPTSLWGPWFDVPYKNFFLAIARNLYVHPGRIQTCKQWGFIGNAVYQVYRLLDAPMDQVHKKTFYLADYVPIDLRDFANRVQMAMGAKPIRTIPAKLLRVIAWLGDVAQKLGWANPPLTSFRYRNIVTNETQDANPLREIVGPLPYSIDQGIDLTVRWLFQNDVRVRRHSTRAQPI